MKTKMLTMAALSVLVLHAHGQGYFLFDNDSARTRHYTFDGPLAGRGIWAHMFVGLSPDTLAPVGGPAEHTTNGRVYGGVIFVPGIPGPILAYAQMVAWDGTLWGTNLAGVPADQFGRTDTVLTPLGAYDLPPVAPEFTQPAIVPVPEPSVLGLAILGGAILFFGRQRSFSLSQWSQSSSESVGSG